MALTFTEMKSQWKVRLHFENLCYAAFLHFLLKLNFKSRTSFPPLSLALYVAFIFSSCFSIHFTSYTIFLQYQMNIFFILISLYSIHHVFSNAIWLRSYPLQHTYSVLVVVLFTDFNEITDRKHLFHPMVTHQDWILRNTPTFSFIT